MIHADISQGSSQAGGQIQASSWIFQKQTNELTDFIVVTCAFLPLNSMLLCCPRLSNSTKKTKTRGRAGIKMVLPVSSNSALRLPKTKQNITYVFSQQNITWCLNTTWCRFSLVQTELATKHCVAWQTIAKAWLLRPAKALVSILHVFLEIFYITGLLVCQKETLIPCG